MNFTKFPCVVNYKCNADYNFNFAIVMYNENSGVVVETGQVCPYTVGQVIDGRISFKDESEVTIDTMPFEITRHAQKLKELAQKRERELAIYNQVLQDGGIK